MLPAADLALFQVVQEDVPRHGVAGHVQFQELLTVGEGDAADIALGQARRDQWLAVPGDPRKMSPVFSTDLPLQPPLLSSVAVQPRRL